MNAINKLTEKEYWASTWERLSQQSHDFNNVLFKRVFRQYVDTNTHCFEVGCFPGKYLLYLRTTYGCRVSGIDYVEDKTMIDELFRLRNENYERITIADFEHFTSDQQYDFVFSVGFIEHFVEFERIIRKHADLVSDNGYLFIACPNFKGSVQYWLHRLLDANNLRRHYLPAMDLEKWRVILEQCGMTVVESGYEDTFRFWVDGESNRNRVVKMIVRRIKRLGRFVNSHVHYPNHSTSPYLYCVATKHTPQALSDS